MGDFSTIREHMNVIGADGVNVGTVDRRRRPGSRRRRQRQGRARRASHFWRARGADARMMRCVSRPMPCSLALRKKREAKPAIRLRRGWPGRAAGMFRTRAR